MSKYNLLKLFIAIVVLFVGMTWAQVANAQQANPVGWCKLGNDPQQQSLNWDGARRMWMSDDLAYNIKVIGGHCELDWGASVAFTLNSVEGTIRVNGEALPYPRPNGLSLNARTVVFDYARGNNSNGFDAWLAVEQAPVSNQQGTGAYQRPDVPAPAADASGEMTRLEQLEAKVDTLFEAFLLFIKGDTDGAIEVLQTGSAQADAPAVADTSTGEQPLTGVCTTKDGTASWVLPFDSSKGILYADPVMDSMRESNANQEITCSVTNSVDAVVHNIGQNIEIAAGEGFSYTYKVNDPSLGLSVDVVK